MARRISPGWAPAASALELGETASMDARPGRESSSERRRPRGRGAWMVSMYDFPDYCCVLFLLLNHYLYA